MSLPKAAFFNVFTRTDGPRRETLRRERARLRTQSRSQTNATPDRPKLILASASPRRLTLLGQVGIEPDALRPASIDETPKRGEMPRGLVTRLARTKAETARDQIANDTDIADAYVLAADTIVALGRRILGKPADDGQARAMLTSLSGRTHRVLSAVALWTGTRRFEALNLSHVRFAALPARVIDAYVASGEPFGKAGAYAIQSALAGWIERIDGSHSGIMGLPLAETAALLRRAKVAHSLSA